VTRALRVAPDAAHTVAEAGGPHPALQVVTNFNDNEVSKLLKLFSTHAGSLDGITKEQFQTIPLLQHSPFNDRLFDVMDKDGSGVMSLLEFAQLMSTLSERSSKDQKLRLTFEVYDHDRHGRLTPNIRTINP